MPQAPLSSAHPFLPASRFLVALMLFAARLCAGEIDLAWPTPLPVFAQELDALECFQATASGEAASGAFGCARSGGAKYHEGIDIKATKRDRRGEPLDEIFAAMEGVVRHINTLGGDSGYGRYVVLEHPGQSPAVYTLYAHLSAIAPGLRRGDRVTKGQVIGTLGHTAGGYSIPRDRSHLHFEIGLSLSQNFHSWYQFKQFGSPNRHGTWNGLNLVGIDAWDCIAAWRKGRIRTFTDYLARLPVAVKLRIATLRVPDFVQRYPELLPEGRPEGLVSGWEVHFSATGLPLRWKALSPLQVTGLKPNQVEVLWTDDALLQANRCRDLVDVKRGRKTPGKDLRAVLELLFNLR